MQLKLDKLMKITYKAMKFLNAVCTHLVIVYQDPKSYRKYICYCIRHRKIPDTKMLIKLLRIAYIAKQLK